MVEIKNIFPNYIAKSKINLKIFKGLFKNAEVSFESNLKTTLEGKNLFTSEEMNYLNVELTNIFSELLSNYDVKSFVFHIESIWKNFYEDKNFQGNHIHPTHFSFIIYNKVDKSHTVFNNPVKSIIEAMAHIDDPFKRSFEPKCEEGDIIVFPSYLDHWVRPNSNNETIAGNVVFSKIVYKQ